MDAESEVVVRTDDSIIEDDGTRQQRGMEKVASGVMSLERYLREFEGLSLEEAAEEAALIREATQAAPLF